MLIGLQILGLIFALGMLYITYTSLKRHELNKLDFVFWALLWVLFMLANLFSDKLDFFFETLKIQGAMWFFTVIGFIFLTCLGFYLYKGLKRNQKKIEKIIQQIALENKDKK